MLPDGIELCPLCGALPCDWGDNPHEQETGLCWTMAKIREALDVFEKPMMDELPGIVAAMKAERDRLAAMVEKLRGYAVHERGCEIDRHGAECDCGLSDLLKESENG